MIGHVAPVQAVVVRSETLIVVADRFLCYPSGFEFQLSVRGAAVGPMMMMGGPHRGRGGPGGGAEDAFRFGVAFADARKATDLGPNLFPHAHGGAGAAATASGATPAQVPLEPDAPVLMLQSASATDLRWDQICWVWGLPPEGPLGVVVEWRAEGISETRAEVDSALIRQAAERAETVWED